MALEWHSYPVLPCLLAWFSPVNSQVILRYSLTTYYKMAASSPHGYIHPVCVCVHVCDTHLCSTLPAKFSVALILSILKPEGKDNPFSAFDVRLCCPELWPPSCDHERSKLTAEEDTRALKMDNNLGSGWCRLVVELTSPGLGCLYEIKNLSC